jgi:hypothetical protein
MYISDERKLMFVHVRKTGGISVTSAIGNEDGSPHPLCLPKGFPHETVEEFCQRHGEEVFRRYTSFCFVRHPLDRFVSQYRFMLGRTEKIPFMKAITTVRQFIESIERNVQVKILLGDTYKVEDMATLARPQVEYIQLGIKNIAVNFVFQQEIMRNQWGRICDVLGITHSPLQELNKSHPYTVDDINYVRAFVSDYYKRDFETFGYSVN